MNKHLFSGTGVALVTPFDKSGNVDFRSLTGIVEHVISGNVDYLVAMGTTGESVVLNNDEKQGAVKHIIRVSDGQCPVVLGMGGNNTSSLIDQINKQDFDGISGILSVSPYYNKPTQEGIYAHYSEIAKASPLPVILYNVPGRTGSMINPDTTLRLANDFSNIVAIKEASGDLCAITKILKHKPGHFAVVSGDDALALPMISLGAQGVISVIANAYPRKMSSLVNYSLQNNFESARNIHYQIIEMIDAIFQDGNPGGIKSLLYHLGIAEEHLRLPLVPVSEETSKKIKKLAGQIL